MNRENLLKVREDIANADPKHCNMRHWYCGGVMCIGGFADRRSLVEDRRSLVEGSADRNVLSLTAARDYLELTYEEEKKLFFNYPDNEPEIGWKAWMLRRIDSTLRNGTVPILSEEELEGKEDPEEL